MKSAVRSVPALLLLLPTLLLADTPAAAPATRPVYTLLMPPGMETVTVGPYTAICPPPYKELVRKGLAQITPATRPTTMASDILKNLAASRKLVQDEMVADFNLPAAQVADFLENTLKPALEKVSQFHSTSYIIVASQDEMIALMRGGWHAPLFHYNPLANHVFYSPSVPVTSGVAQDDVVLWNEVKPGESDADTIAGMNLQMHNFEGGFQYVAGQVALLEVRRQLIQFLSEKVVKPLSIPDTEQWFTFGILGVMGSKYGAIITGSSRASMVAAFSSDDPNAAVQSGPLDLLHEFDSRVIKPQYQPLYLEAVSRKGTAVVEKLVESAGDSCILKILTAIRAKMPADGTELVAVIKSQTGVDLTNDLSPK